MRSPQNKMFYSLVITLSSLSHKKVSLPKERDGWSEGSLERWPAYPIDTGVALQGINYSVLGGSCCFKGFSTASCLFSYPAKEKIEFIHSFRQKFSDVT